MNLINEEDTWHELSDTVVDVAIDDLVDLETQLLCDLSLLWAIDLGHETEEIVATLRPCVGAVQIMKSHVLDDLLLLVDVALWDWDILFCFQVIFCGV